MCLMARLYPLGTRPARPVGGQSLPSLEGHAEVKVSLFNRARLSHSQTEHSSLSLYINIYLETPKITEDSDGNVFVLWICNIFNICYGIVK